MGEYEFWHRGRRSDIVEGDWLCCSTERLCGFHTAFTGRSLTWLTDWLLQRLPVGWKPAAGNMKVNLQRGSKPRSCSFSLCQTCPPSPPAHGLRPEQTSLQRGCQQPTFPQGMCLDVQLTNHHLIFGYSVYRFLRAADCTCKCGKSWFTIMIFASSH